MEVPFSHVFIDNHMHRASVAIYASQNFWLFGSMTKKQLIMIALFSAVSLLCNAQEYLRCSRHPWASMRKKRNFTRKTTEQGLTFATANAIVAIPHYFQVTVAAT